MGKDTSEVRATELLRRAEQYGAHLGVEDGRVYVEPLSAVPPNLLAELKSHKGELLAVLTVGEWPPESLDCERRFGHVAARLYPFLGKRVDTKLGPGQLLQLLNGTAAVLLDAEQRQATFLHWRQVRPPPRGGEVPT